MPRQVDFSQMKKLVHWGHFLSREYQVILDTLILAASLGLAYLIRFEFVLSSKEIDTLLIQLPLVILVRFAWLYFSGAYSFIWRYVGLAEVKVFLKAGFGSAVVLLALRFLLPNSLQFWRVPLSVILLDTFLAMAGTFGLRVLRRWIYECYEREKTSQGAHAGERIPALLVGAGRGGAMAVKEIANHGSMGLEILGFVDDSPQSQGMKVQGVKVLGTTRDIPSLVSRLGVKEVVVTIDQAPREFFVKLLETCRELSVKVRVIPGLYKLLQGRYKISRIRDFEIEDLLGREVVQLDEPVIGRFLSGKRVMVTGAGGSIGSELARQVARFQPASILLVERAEFVLFEIDRELREAFPQTKIIPLVGDINDELRLRSIFSTHRPEVIFHAAAHKHVPLMEFNPTEAIKNNSLATRLLGEMAGEFGVEGFVLISTDKAVNPTSVMGASKRLAELVVQDLNHRYATRFLAVRFGNVLGSSGSVISVFKDQIQKGGPVTVTHPDMVRYFMTIPEAAQLVLQAGAMGRGGEIFVLDMGEPVKILDLAKEMITLTGLKPYENIDIICTGVRPGEKFFEELNCTGEDMTKTRHPKIFIGKIAPYPAEEMKRILRHLTYFSRNGHHQELREYIGQIVPEARISDQDPIAAQGFH